MKILYVAGCVSEGAYERLYGGCKEKPAFQAQKYHRLFIEGLSAGASVEVVGYPPVEKEVAVEGVIAIPDETVGNVHYHYIRTYRHHLRRRLHVGIHSFIKCLKLLDRNSAVMIDCLNQMSGLGALLASKLRRCRCVGIITDLPEYMGGGPTMALAEFLIRHCTDYVVLTQAMNDRVNKKGKPYVVLEGHSDITMAAREPSLKRKARSVFACTPAVFIKFTVSSVWWRVFNWQPFPALNSISMALATISRSWSRLLPRTPPFTMAACFCPARWWKRRWRRRC